MSRAEKVLIENQNRSIGVGCNPWDSFVLFARSIRRPRMAKAWRIFFCFGFAWTAA